MAYRKSVDIIAVYGTKRQGKSTGVKELIEQSGVKRVLVFDAEKEYGDLKGFKKATSKQELFAIVRKNWKGNFKIAYQSKTESPAELNDFCNWAIKIQEKYHNWEDSRQLLLVIEEMATYFPPNGTSPKVQEMSKEVGLLCSKGGHYGINLLGITQRPVEVHKKFRGNANKTRSYFLDEMTDVDFLMTKLPKLVGTTERRQALINIVNLEPHEYITIERGTYKLGQNALIK